MTSHFDTPTINSDGVHDEIHIDGSYKEGGGQILRNSITYAVLLQKSVTINNVRANRPNQQGIRPQHLSGMNLAVALGDHDGSLIGGHVGSSTVSYVPSRNKKGDEGTIYPNNTGDGKFIADTGTAGSIALLLQSSFLPALFRSIQLKQKLEIEFHGGTNAENAPQIDYVTHVLAPFINRYFRLESTFDILELNIMKRGFFPMGGGLVCACIHPPIFHSKRTTFPPIQLTKCPSISSLSLHAFHAGNCPSWIPHKMIKGAMEVLSQAFNDNDAFRCRFRGGIDNMDEKNVTISSFIKEREISHHENCVESASGIIIVAHPRNSLPCDINKSNTHMIYYPPMAASTLGQRKIKPLQSGADAANELVECISSGGCIDRWLQDQLIPFMALADNVDSEGGIQKSEVLLGELTQHTQTAMKVAEWVTGCHFEVERLDTVVITGVRHKRQRLNDYGEVGSIPGRHIIRCVGSSFQYF